MNYNDIKQVLDRVKNHELDPDQAADLLKDFSFQELEYAKIDHHRELRRGYPEIIFCEGKTHEQVRGIIRAMLEAGSDIMATRATPDLFKAVSDLDPKLQYHETARIIYIRQKKPSIPDTSVCVITAGTSDIPVAEEAAITAELLGNHVERVFDVGVAGIHRLVKKLDVIKKSRVVIVVAGMEGALASIVGGLINIPVVAVPTSVGYGANFNGLSALLAMLTSCAGGVAVMNIDNGFGAGYYASMINKLD
jgi:NCAIR mutase (PurE)-related protein